MIIIDSKEMKDKTLEELNSNHVKECPCFYCEKLARKVEAVQEAIIETLNELSDELSERDKKFSGAFRPAD